jgi:hypothetical protein
VIGLLRAWGGAILVLIIGVVTLAGLTPRTAPGEPISVSDQAFRIHLPWFVMTVLMVLAAAALHWRSPSTARLLLATLPVPVLAVVAGAATGVAGATSALPALLYVVEGVAGTALGLFATGLFGRVRETDLG